MMTTGNKVTPSLIIQWRSIWFMIDVREDKDDNRSKENIFQIIDGIITQLNRTKKMFIIMILTIMIIPPISFIVTFALFGPPFPFHDDRMMPSERFGQGGFGPGFHAARMIPFLISLIWLGI